MYPARPSTRIDENEARKIVGDKLIDEVLSMNCEFTSRVIDDCFGVYELSATAYNDIHKVTVYYLLDKEDVKNNGDDLGQCDYSDYSFEIDY